MQGLIHIKGRHTLSHLQYKFDRRKKLLRYSLQKKLVPTKACIKTLFKRSSDYRYDLCIFQ